ncbi:MAG: diguanylate cyclase [Anaerolineaceae bacterium]|nr:diguanylate cyclase [Anaerolineaceae bacterium]
MQFTPELWLFILSAFILLLLFINSWQYRNQDIGRYFLYFMLCAFIWVTFFIFETVFPLLNTKMIFVYLEFIGIVFLPLTWVLIIFTFTGTMLSTFTKRLLFVLPFLTTIIIWTNPLHHWFIGYPKIITTNVPFPTLNLDYQFWFHFIHAPTGYIYILTSLVILIRYLIKAEEIYKIQARILLVAILLPTITDILYVFGISPIKYYNFTTAVFSVSGVLLLWALFRFHFLDLLPLARDHIIENLSDGIIVLDHKSRLAYINQTARFDFQLTQEHIGQSIYDLKNTCIQQIKEMLGKKQIQNVSSTISNDSQYYDLRLAPVINTRGFQIGIVASMHDVTQRVQQYQQVHTLSIQDDLTGIANRRHFIDICNRDLDRIQQFHNGSAAIIMIDIDAFKSINDQYGHAIGDKVLINFSQIIQSTLRRHDYFGRWGGDEFALFLNGVSMKEAKEIVGRIRNTINAHQQLLDQHNISITASYGIVHTQQVQPAQMNIETLIDLADQALYQGKDAGKDFIQCYQPEN